MIRARYQKPFFCFLFLLAIIASPAASADDQYVSPMQKLTDHPRLLLQRGEEKKMMRDVRKDDIWIALHQDILRTADQYATQPYHLLKRKKIGKRLLSVSREALKRIFYLSYAYRTTNDVSYLDAARAEMLNVATFTDWNPSHYLDVAEMTLAVSIGYDWLYDKLSPEDRLTIRKCIIEKGLLPSTTNDKDAWFIKANNNWNQVCHAGMVFGALAVWEDSPELSAEIINRAIRCLPYSMAAYAPDGVYPEGNGYWAYGTTFNVLLLDALDKNFKSDFGLSEAPGFLQTGEFKSQIVTPHLYSFCFSDNGRRTIYEPAIFWFYRKTKSKSLLYSQIKLMQARIPGTSPVDRLAPANIIWGHEVRLSLPKQPSQLSWTGNGTNPIYVTRSGWDDGESYMGMKGGTPSANHGHMDVGTFLFESHGIQWATDLGAENYNTLEQAGLGIWSMSQTSERWTVNRYNNFCHNTLTFDGQYQTVKGNVQLEEQEEGFPGSASADLTPVYQGQVKKAYRTCALLAHDDFCVTDRIETLNHTTELTWTMITEATVTKVDEQTLLLQRDGHRMFLRFSGIDNGVAFFERPAPTREFENPNNSFTRIRYITTLPASSTIQLSARLSAE